MRDMRNSSEQVLGVTYHGDQDLVTGGNTHGHALAITVEGTGADGENLGLVLLLDAALREEDTGGSLGLGLDALDQDAVHEGSKALDVTEDRLLREKKNQYQGRDKCVKLGWLSLEKKQKENCANRGFHWASSLKTSL